MLFASFVFLPMEVWQTYGLQKIQPPCQPGQPCVKFPTLHRPTVIPQAKCKAIVNKLPKRRQRLICLQLSEDQLLYRLKDAGGYNPRYVAINRKEALKFANLVTAAEPLLPAKISSLDRKKLLHYLGNRSDVSSFLHQEKQMAIGAGQNSQSSRRSLANQVCFDKGSNVDGSPLRRMCTECSGITQLPANVFPPFINEVVCGGDGVHFCYINAGICQQRVLKSKFLRFTGNFVFDPHLNVYVQELETFDRDIRTCCECRVFPMT